MKFKDQLKALNACKEAIEWVGDKTLEQVWNECNRADWLLWLCGKLDIDRKTLVYAACQCARPVLKYVPNGEDRPLKAIEITEAWTRGEATLEQVENAARAARAAFYAAKTTHATYASDAAYAAFYAANAAYVARAAYAAYYAANATNVVYEPHVLANIVRKHIQLDMVADKMREYFTAEEVYNEI